MSSLKWTPAVLVMAMALTTASPNAALAERDEYEDSQSHPLRVAAYLIHPVGYALEWALFRPFHYLVSSPGAEEVFGHTPHGCSDYGSGSGCFVRSPAYSEEYIPAPRVAAPIDSRDAARAEDAAARAERAAESAKRAAEHGMLK